MLICIVLAHEAAIHREKLRQEISHSRREQNDYLRKVELARVLDKRIEKKRKRAEEQGLDPDEAELGISNGPSASDGSSSKRQKKEKAAAASRPEGRNIESILDDVF